MVLLYVTFVLSNVLPVKDLLITVPLVLKTELVLQIVIVTLKVVIMKSLNKLSVHLVTVDVQLVLHTKFVNLVLLTESMLQIVIVFPIIMKINLIVNAKNVATNVLNVQDLTIIVNLVLLTEFLLLVVSVLMELMITVLKQLNVNFVTKYVVLVLVAMVLV